MTVGSILTWAGSDAATWASTVLAGLGMAGSWWQAKNARKSVTSVEEIRDEIRNQIADRNAHGELSSLNSVLGSALRAMDKYGPGSGPTARRGSSPEGDAAEVRALTVEITRLRVMLIPRFGDDVADVPVRINQLLTAFAQASGDNERVQRGCDIYLEISEFSANVKQALDSNILR